MSGLQTATTVLIVGLTLASCARGQQQEQERNELRSEAGVDLPPLRPLQVETGSPWYLDRGAWRRVPRKADDLPTIGFLLQRAMRDRRVPGFYDGQFDSTASAFDELARLAGDPAVNHVLRMMAVMALQEAGNGPTLASVLEPLVMPARQECDIEDDFIRDTTSRSDEHIRERLDAELSRYARFALAKAGQTRLIRDKLALMKDRVDRLRSKILDPGLLSDRHKDVRLGRARWFSIGYHYQQFDDFETARLWYDELCRALPGHRDTSTPHYNLACIAALQGRPEDALDHLERAFETGFTDLAWMDEDGDLTSLHGREDYRALRAAMGGRPAPQPPISPPFPDETPDRDAP